MFYSTQAVVLGWNKSISKIALERVKTIVNWGLSGITLWHYNLEEEACNGVYFYCTYEDNFQKWRTR